MAKQMPGDIGANRAQRIATRAATTNQTSEVESKARQNAILRTVPVFRLAPHELQPLERHADENVADLMESIRSIGLQEPPLVRRVPDGKYIILAGHRRTRAWQLLALDGRASEKIRAFVLDDISDSDSLKVIAAEFAHRTDFGVLHKAKVVGAAIETRRQELGRDPSSREMRDLVPWEKSQLAKYRKVHEALKDPRLAPAVHRVDNPDITLLYNILTAKDFSRTVHALEAYANHDAAAARKVLSSGRRGRPKKTLARHQQGNGYNLTIRYQPSMTTDDARSALEALDVLRQDLNRVLDVDAG